MEMLHPLKTYREVARLTQFQLAKLLGVTRTTVARWETGARKVDEDHLLKIAETTGISPSELRPDLAALMKPSTSEPEHSEQSSIPAQA